jgi:hypothetical protein
MHEVLERVHCTLMASEVHAMVKPRCATTTPACRRMSVDRDQMLQAVLNIVRNAMQAVGPGRADHRCFARRVARQLRSSASSAAQAGREHRDRGRWARRRPGTRGLDFLSAGVRPQRRHRAGPAAGAGDPQPPWGPHRVSLAAWRDGVHAAPAGGARGGPAAFWWCRMSGMALTVWVVDDDDAVRWVLDKALKAAGIRTRSIRFR